MLAFERSCTDHGGDGSRTVLRSIVGLVAGELGEAAAIGLLLRVGHGEDEILEVLSAREELHSANQGTLRNGLDTACVGEVERVVVVELLNLGFGGLQKRLGDARLVTASDMGHSPRAEG